MKINVHRPTGTRVVFDEEGNAVAPLARVADTKSGNESFLIDEGIYGSFLSCNGSNMIAKADFITVQLILVLL